MAFLRDDSWPALLHDDYTSCGHTTDPYSIASQSARIASCLLELEKVNEDLESKLRDDFNSILSSMDRLSLSPTAQPPSPPLNTPTRSVSHHNPSFATAAHSWLLENIANPYPSSTVKASLAQQYNYPLSSVSTWFINARRRMGWTTLCRDHFNSCREDTLDAAYRALVNEDPRRPLSPDVIHAFITVKVTAEGLFSSTPTKGALSGILDAVVPDQEAILAREHREHEKVESPEILEAQLQNEKRVAQYCYTSPDSSCSSSPVPPLVESLTDDSEEEEVSPPILAGRKRRLSSSEPAHSTLSAKRKKYGPTSYRPVETRLSSSDETLFRDQDPSSTSFPQNSTNVPTPRKRYLSHADATGKPKHPQELTAEPRPHAVSDPLPLSMLESDHSLDEWFSSNFETLFAFPLPADVTEPDLTAQWEVELFSSYNIPLQGPSPKSLNPPTGNHESTLVDSNVLDSFLRSLESGASIAPSETTVPSVPQDLSLSSDSIDWTALFNWPAEDPSLDSIFGQFHADSLLLPEVDLPILQLS